MRSRNSEDDRFSEETGNDQTGCHKTSHHNARQSVDKMSNRIRRNSDISSPSTSPVLGRGVCSYRKRRNVETDENVPTPARSPILGRKSSSKRIKQARAVDLNMNSTASRAGTVVTERLQDKQKSGCTRNLRLLFEEPEKHSQIRRRAVLVSILNVPDRQEGKDDDENAERIEIESSGNEDNDVSATQAIRIDSSDTDCNSSDTIEIEATQNIAVDKDQDRSPLLAALSSSHSQTSDESLDETFFSQAERCPKDLIGAKPSQQISQSSSPPVNDIAERQPSEVTVVIDTETSPQRVEPDASMQLSLLDSGKKRKKPKRGSLTEKLRSMINKQTSSVRVWRYQLKRTMEQRTPVACVTVLIEKCVNCFDKQFLEGFVVEDPHGLWSRDGQFLRIMLVPEIVGKMKVKSVGLAQIFPPWEVLDDRVPMLNVNFVRVVPNSEADAKRYESTRRADSRKRTIIEEFDCPCIKACEMIASCKDRFVRPNVMQRLFKRET